MHQILTCLALPAPDCLRRGIFPDGTSPGLGADVPAHLPDADLTLLPIESWPPESPPHGMTGPFHPAPALRAAAMGEWRGRALRDLPAADLARWVSDPDFAPPGGESRTELLHRVAVWLAALPPTPPRLSALADATVVRAIVVAALGGTARMLSHLDIAPRSRTVLTRHATWRVAMTGAPPDGL
ncbi:histidine phosphatase family protein [Komagataeibacter sp. FNDCR2]|uniref:histidine phosphatase family protein n=1 Tax=Komagataeibacter sp. FNDCR2 TaxID=2878682 RepID=UPI001E42AA17|nr:histidine phosphatase family protein [Komagataeibacter sp. FNDCR2]MCE2575883.1 histidine phosphatase family protein [Komagataeibacter sp. FNDCR2]